MIESSVDIFKAAMIEFRRVIEEFLLEGFSGIG